MGADTIFHKIIRKEIPAQIVYEDDSVIAFRDVQPVAPVHVLVVPKIDLESLVYGREEHQNVLGAVMLACQKVAEKEGLLDGGFRVVINNGSGVGQSVFQLHAHVLGGRDFQWPPG